MCDLLLDRLSLDSPHTLTKRLYSLDKVENCHPIANGAQDRISIGCENNVPLLVNCPAQIRKLVKRTNESEPSSFRS